MATKKLKWYAQNGDLYHFETEPAAITSGLITAGTNVTVTRNSTTGAYTVSSNISSLGEAYLTWGGKNFAGAYSPIDAAMVPDLGANRLAFVNSAGIEIEYSRDGGKTWVDFGATEAQKVGLFSDINQSLIIGNDTTKTGVDKTNYMLRVTVNTGTASVYTALNKFIIYISTNGSTGSYCTITARLQSDYEAGAETWKTFADKVSLSGWSGFNVINTSSITTYGNNKTSQYGQVRFTFGVTSHATTVAYAGLTVQRIFGFGGVGWTTPSTMAAKGTLYNWDYAQNMILPANIRGTTTNTSDLGTTSYTFRNLYLGTGLVIGGKTLTAPTTAGKIASEEWVKAQGYEKNAVISVAGKTGAVTLTASDVGLGNVDNVKQYSASNPPPYPVTSVNSKTGAVSLTKSDVGLSNVQNADTTNANNITSGTLNVARLTTNTANGVAKLDGDGKIPASLLPSYVDDVLEYTNKSNFPTTGETGKIYVDTTSNLTYRWSGTAYVEISPSIALGETSSTAYAGDKGAKNASNIKTLQDVTAAISSSLNEKLPLSGGSITGDITFTNTYVASTSNMTGRYGIKWSAVNGKTPYIGYDKVTQTDGTFIVCDITGGGDYKQGLAIGGGSGNLLWKGTKIATTSDIPTVGTASLTIQKNGATVATFGANATSGVTANITMAKGDVGLGNVQNVDQTNANNLTSGTVPIARIPTTIARQADVDKAIATLVPKSGDSTIEGALTVNNGIVVGYENEENRIKLTTNAIEVTAAGKDYTLSFPLKSGNIATTNDLSDYLPLSGGKIKGRLEIANQGGSAANAQLHLLTGTAGTTEVGVIRSSSNASAMLIEGYSSIYMAPGASGYQTSNRIMFERTNNADHIRPETNNVSDLGASSQKWKNLYLAGNIYNSSGNAISLPTTAGKIALTSDIPAAIDTSKFINKTEFTSPENEGKVLGIRNGALEAITNRVFVRYDSGNAGNSNIQISSEPLVNLLFRYTNNSGKISVTARAAHVVNNLYETIDAMCRDVMSESDFTRGRDIICQDTICVYGENLGSDVIIGYFDPIRGEAKPLTVPGNSFAKMGIFVRYDSGQRAIADLLVTIEGVQLL